MASLHPEWTEFLTKNPDISHDEAGRNGRFLSNPDNSDLENGVNITESSVTARDGYRIPIRLYNARYIGYSQGVAIFFHSGGFVGGSMDTEDIFCRYMALKGSAAVISIEYRLCPAYVYPVPMNDAWDATKHIIGNIHEYAPTHLAGPVKLVICGTSSGGQLACITSQKTRAWLEEPTNEVMRDKVVLTGVLLRAPVTVRGVDSNAIPPRFKDQHKSWCAALETLRLDMSGMEEIHDALEVPAEDISSPEAYPLWGDLTGPGKAFIQICEVDILRDDGLCYAEGLQSGGVEVRKTLYNCLPHIFWVYGPDLNVSKLAQEDAVEGLRWLLGIENYLSGGDK